MAISVRVARLRVRVDQVGRLIAHQALLVVVGALGPLVVMRQRRPPPILPWLLIIHSCETANRQGVMKAIFFRELHLSRRNDREKV